MKKRLTVIIQPGIEHLQSIYQSFRIGTEIRFTIGKFHTTDGCPKRFLRKTVFYDIGKHFFNRCKKLLFTAYFGILGNDTEELLTDSVFICGIHIFADALLNEGRFQGRTRSRADGIVEYADCRIQKPVHALSHYHIVC